MDANTAWKQQQDFLKKEQESRPLLSDKMSTETLVEEFKDASDVYKKKTAYLKDSYSSIYFVRRDGNCFIRSSVLGIFLYLSRCPKEEKDRIMKIIQDTLKYAVSGGYDEFILEDFSEVMIEEATFALTAKEEDIVARLQQKETSDYVVMFLRFVIAVYMKDHAENFISFIPEATDMAQYVRSEIEPMGRESEETSIIALSSYFGIGIKVEYLDQTETQGKTNFHVFPFEHKGDPAFVLLFRPGHFDLIIK